MLISELDHAEIDRLDRARWSAACHYQGLTVSTTPAKPRRYRNEKPHRVFDPTVGYSRTFANKKDARRLAKRLGTTVISMPRFYYR